MSSSNDLRKSHGAGGATGEPAEDPRTKGLALRRETVRFFRVRSGLRTGLKVNVPDIISTGTGCSEGTWAQA